MSLVRIGILVSVMVIVNCSSTSSLDAGSPLPGIGLGASKNAILLSWAEAGPLDKMLRPNTRVNILASYSTEFGPVTNEVLGTSSVRAGFNGIKLELAESLKFPPSGPVCLRLAVGRTPIPVRIARSSESSNGFYYEEWASHVALNSKKAFLQSQLTNISANIEVFSKPDRNFELWQRKNSVHSSSECSSLTIASGNTRPLTALQGQAKIDASKEQCVALYNELFAQGVLPDASTIVKAASGNSAYESRAKEMQNDFNKYTSGKVYFPYSQFPVDSATIYSIGSTGNGVSEVAASLVVEAYQACEMEARTRFEESLRDWNEVTNPQSVADRVEPLRKLCRKRFSQNDARLEKLDGFHQAKASLEQKIQNLNTYSPDPLPTKKLLIPHACPAESI